MENQLYSKFKDFLNEIDSEKIESIWMHQSSIFRDFWKDKIIKENSLSLTDSEIDEIVLILDKNAKGSTKNTIAVAKVLIPQGVWRRLFKEIQNHKELKKLLYEILLEKDKQKQIELIDKLYEFNKGKKNSLTGKSGNAINTMLFAFRPEEYLPIVSLNDRKKIIEHFKIDCLIDFENDSFGKNIVESNKIILDGFKKYNIDTKPYILSDFLYKKLRSEWKLIDESSSEISEENNEEFLESPQNFSMEKELENFIITNWDRTNLSKEYELIEEEGEMKSQQYHISTGDFIDILVKDKKTGQYIVIELKKNKTSDKTIGQLARYMGWIEQHKSNGKTVKGIIIAPSYDEKLDYALKILKKSNEIEVYIYEIDFKLKEFKKI